MSLTDSLTVGSQINTAYPDATPGAEDYVARRMSTLANTDPWLPPTANYALASSGIDSGTLGSVVGAARSAYAAVDGGINSIFGDPVLYKAPTAALTLQRYVQGVTGPPPITQQHVVDMQAQLQKMGFGANLPADGMWNAAWDAAWRQHGQKVTQDALAGNAPGSMSAGHALKAMTAILPKEAAHGLIGWFKSMPHLVRKLVADVAGAAVGTPLNLIGDVTGWHDPGDIAGSTVGGAIMGQSAEQYAGAFTGHKNVAFQQGGAVDPATGHPIGGVVQLHPFGSIWDDASTALMLVTIAKAPFSIIAAARDAAEAGSAVAAEGSAASRALQGFRAVGPGRGAALQELGLEQAQRTSGVIARTLGRGLDIGDAKFLQNIPVMDRVGPWVAKLNDADGLYYRARTLVATPYVYAPVRAIGTASHLTGVIGAEARAAGAISNTLSGGQSTLEHNILSTHVLDPVDDAIKSKLQFTLLGVRIRPGIDDLVPFGLHAPHGAAPRLVGQQVGDLLDGYQRLIGPDTSIGAQIQRGTGASSLESLVKSAIGAATTGLAKGTQRYDEAAAEAEVGFWKLWNNNVHEHAAAFHADMVAKETLKEAGAAAMPDLSHADWVASARAAEHQAWSDPAVMKEAVTQMLASPNELMGRIRKQIANSGLDPLAFMNRGIGSFLPAAKIMREEIVPHEDFLLHEMGLGGATADVGATAAATRGAVSQAAPLTAPLGLARVAKPGEADAVSTLTKQSASRMADDLEKRMAAPKTLEDSQQLERDVNDALFQHFGLDAQRMPHDLATKIQRIRDRSEMLASEVYPGNDAPQEVYAAFDKLKRLGYQPVVGTDIGWHFKDVPLLDGLTDGLTWRRRAAGAIGLDPGRFTSSTAGLWRYTGARQSLQAAVDAGELHLPPYQNVDSMLHVLRDGGNLEYRQPWLRGALMDLRGIPDDSQMAEMRTAALAKDPKLADLKPSDLRRVLLGRAQDEASMGLGMRSISRRQVVKALTSSTAWAPETEEGLARASAQASRDAEIATLTKQLEKAPEEMRGPMQAQIDHLQTSPLDEVLPGGLPGMARDEAHHFYTTMVKGMSNAPPTYMVGISKLEDMFRAGFGFAGKALPGSWGDRMATLPNDLIRLRNQLRFDLNPEFSARRVLKTNMKLIADGVNPTFRPRLAMEKAGTLAEDRARFDGLFPNPSRQFAREGSDYIDAHDMFGFYNAHDYEAYAAGKWARQGLTDDQIRERVVRTFNYGTYFGGKAGRTGLEQSMNFLFFPFSFEKTVARNLGAYLLDRPAQALLLTNALSAYNEFNQHHLDGSNPFAASFVEKHIPMMKELERLNPLAHGLSLGQFGGINRPLLNLFLPQQLAANAANVDRLGSFAPIWKELQSVYTQGHDQAHVVGTAIGNAWDSQTHPAPTTFTNIRQPAESHIAQLQDGAQYNRDLKAALKSWTDANGTRAAADQIRFPTDPKFGKFANMPITNKVIGYIVNDRFPAWDPAAGLKFAADEDKALMGYKFALNGAGQTNYVAFLDTATEIARKLQNDTYPSTQTAAAAAQAVRDAAIQIAETDPRFLKLWDGSFRRYFGPLVKV